ncbi:MAG: hypothetical protein HQL50_12600 [Magnetococcales bacterium]|nr:hypothetical protein [Magnetococcales bacterium]
MNLFTPAHGVRSFSVIPRSVWLLMVIALAGQLTLTLNQSEPIARAEDLPQAPALNLLRITSLNEPETLARLLMIHLQTFDYQSGVSVPFHNLDYAALESWLERAIALDPRSSYPLHAASRLYAEIDDPERRLRMIRLIHRHFIKHPNHHWPWMAHAVLITHHKLHDSEQALVYARQLATLPEPGTTPTWVSEMAIPILEDMGRFDEARATIRSLLETNTHLKPEERAFLEERYRSFAHR